MLLAISPPCLYHNVPMMLAEEKRDPERILDPTLSLVRLFDKRLPSALRHGTGVAHDRA